MPHETRFSREHAPDMALTGANIEWVQAQRESLGLRPLAPDEIVALFVRYPEPRHYNRAAKLMVGGCWRPNPKANGRPRTTPTEKTDAPDQG